MKTNKKISEKRKKEIKAEIVQRKYWPRPSIMRDQKKQATKNACRGKVNW